MEDSFTIKTPATEESEKVVELARAVSSKLTGVAITDIVLRTADFNAARGASGGSLGPQCEGAIVALLRERIDRPLVLLSGRGIAVALGISKVEAEDAGKDLAGRHAKAAAAALSALPH